MFARQSLRAEGVRHLGDFDRRRLHDIAKIGWNKHVKDARIRNELLNIKSGNIVMQRIQLSSSLTNARQS